MPNSKLGANTRRYRNTSPLLLPWLIDFLTNCINNAAVCSPSPSPPLRVCTGCWPQENEHAKSAEWIMDTRINTSGREERNRERGREGGNDAEEEGLERRGQLGCVFNMQIEEMGLHHAVLAASVIFRAVPLPGLYPCDLPILILCKSTPSPSLPPSFPSGRRCIECFWCPFVFYHHHPLPHERVPTFRFSINWLDYSSHSNQLARHTRLFALVIEIIIGPGEDIYICIYISVVRY